MSLSLQVTKTAVKMTFYLFKYAYSVIFLFLQQKKTLKVRHLGNLIYKYIINWRIVFGVFFYTLFRLFCGRYYLTEKNIINNGMFYSTTKRKRCIAVQRDANRDSPCMNKYWLIIIIQNNWNIYVCCKRPFKNTHKNNFKKTIAINTWQVYTIYAVNVTTLTLETLSVRLHWTRWYNGSNKYTIHIFRGEF